MDEMLDWQARPLPAGHPHNFRTFMERHFYGGIAPELAVPEAQRHWLLPSTVEAVGAAIAEAQIDVTLGGWGQDGHVAYNQARRHPFSHVSLTDVESSTIRIQDNNIDTILALAHRTLGAAYQFVPPMSITLGMRECLSAAKDAGVNFFDNAESYGGGESERVMGAAFRELGWQRHEYVVSTKLFWGLHENVNMKNTLNRKYLSQAIDASLERFGLDFVDLVFCHRADPNTPIEETVWAMSDMISQGKALYWGTSEWTADEIRAAYDIADRHHLHKPLMEQPQYNILWRDKVVGWANVSVVSGALVADIGYVWGPPSEPAFASALEAELAAMGTFLGLD